MSTNEKIALEGVSVASLKLLGDEVLVRAYASEETKKIRRFDGSTVDLAVPHAAKDFFGRGAEFFGVVVKTGPGREIERQPSADYIASFARKFMDNEVTELSDCDGIRPQDAYKAVDRLYDAVQTYVTENTHMVHVPVPWLVGDHVMCAQGFGPELTLREGVHHLIRRAGKHGHGILAAWSPEHIHCWHEGPRMRAMGEAFCVCGASTLVLATRLPACSECPEGERLAEAPEAAAKVYDFKPGPGPSEAEQRMTEVMKGFKIGEERPE